MSAVMPNLALNSDAPRRARPSSRRLAWFVRAQAAECHMVIKLMASMLFLTGAYYSWEFVEGRNYAWLVIPAVLFAVATGLISSRRWGAVLWYVFAVAMSLWCLGSILYVAFTGWPPYGIGQSVISLIPGTSLIVFCVLGSVAVHRNSLRRVNAAP